MNDERQTPLGSIIGGTPGYPPHPSYPSYPGYPGYPGYSGYAGTPGYPGGYGPGFPPGPGPGPFPGGHPTPGIPPMGGAQGAPTTPPPGFVPQKPGTGGGFQAQAVNPGAIIGCRNRFVYIWQSNGDQYWAYLTFAGRNSVAGYRWNGYWQYFGLDLRYIDQFYCF